MFNDFKKFIARGNLLDLAIGFIMGAAFSTVVKSFTDGIIMPFVGLLTGRIDFSSKCWNLTGEPVASCADAVAKGVAVVQYGRFISEVINFLIVALVMFFLARWALSLFRGLEAESKGPTKEEELLTEIRDILRESSK